jgi:hypothetical protein
MVGYTNNFGTVVVFKLNLEIMSEMTDSILIMFLAATRCSSKSEVLATAQKERWTKAQNSDVLCVTQDEAIK